MAELLRVQLTPRAPALCDVHGCGFLVEHSRPLYVRMPRFTLPRLILQAPPPMTVMVCPEHHLSELEMMWGGEIRERKRSIDPETGDRV